METGFFFIYLCIPTRVLWLAFITFLFPCSYCVDYPFGIRLSQRVDGRTLIMFNARNDHDRAKFCEDLREAILEMDEMENLRIEGELDKQRTAARISRAPNTPSALQPPTPPPPPARRASSQQRIAIQRLTAPMSRLDGTISVRRALSAPLRVFFIHQHSFFFIYTKFLNR